MNQDRNDKNITYATDPEGCDYHVLNSKSLKWITKIIIKFLV